MRREAREETVEERLGQGKSLRKKGSKDTTGDSHQLVDNVSMDQRHSHHLLATVLFLNFIPTFPVFQSDAFHISCSNHHGTLATEILGGSNRTVPDLSFIVSFLKGMQNAFIFIQHTFEHIVSEMVKELIFIIITT